MKNLLLILLLTIGSACQTTNNQLEDNEPKLLFEAKVMDQLLEGYVDAKKFGGLSALIAHRGKIIYEKPVGMQSIERKITMNRESLFRIASMTKPITSVAALQLMETGQLNLNDPVKKYLPAFGSFGVLLPDGTTTAVERVPTVKDLLMHLAGVLPHGHPMFREAQPYSETSLVACVNKISNLPLFHQPGARFTYGPSTNLVGRIVEIVSGQPLKQYVKENILDPLNMNSTFWIVPDADTARVVATYSSDMNLKFINRSAKQSGNFVKGTSGIFTTTSDYFRFAQMLLNKGSLDGIRILKEETIKLLITDHLPEELHPLNAIGTPMPNTGFGLGVAVLNGNPKKWKPAELRFINLGNLPAGSHYWPGVTGTYYWVDPANELIGILLTQTDNPETYPVFQDFHQTFYSNFIYLKKSKQAASLR